MSSNNRQKQIEAAERILNIFKDSKDLTGSVVLQVLDAHNGDADKAIDYLLTMTADLTQASIYKSRAISAGYSVLALPNVKPAPSNQGGLNINKHDYDDKIKIYARTQMTELEKIQLIRRKEQQEGASSNSKQKTFHNYNANILNNNNNENLLSVQKMGDDQDVAQFLKDILPSNKQLGEKEQQQLIAERKILEAAKLRNQMEHERRALELEKKELLALQREKEADAERAKLLRQRELLLQKQEQEQEQLKKQLALQKEKQEIEQLKAKLLLQQQQADEVARKQKELAKLEAELKAEKDKLISGTGGGGAQSSSSSSSNQSGSSNQSNNNNNNTTASLPQIDQPPIIGIYYNKADKKDIQDDIDTLVELFKQKSIAQKDIRICDTSNDIELQAYLKEKCGGRLPLPMVVIHDQPIGNFDDVHELIKSDKLDLLLKAGPLEEKVDGSSEYKQDPNAPELSIGVLGNVLNAGEFVVSGVSSLLWLPWTIVSMPFRSTPEKPKEGTDFLVVHQNWYWRNLHRTFRFTDEEIMRIHPTHGDVRAVHRYDTVDKVTVQDESNIVIQYTDGSSPDYIRASPDDIKQMVTIMIEKSNKKIKLQKTVLSTQL